MKRTSLNLLTCPSCRGRLTLNDNPDIHNIEQGRLNCASCRKDFLIQRGIPHFIEHEQLTGHNRHFSRAYDLTAWAYVAFSKIAFAFIGMDEESGRREITDRLTPEGGRILEVSIGPGVNLSYLMTREDVGEVFGLDISLGQLIQCKHYAMKKDWDVELFLGNGEQLPFQNDSFEGILHVGGINFFNNKQAAINEMIRVAKPGARILIADETEMGARAYDKFIPGFLKSFGGKRDEVAAPFDLVPESMLERRIFDVWKGWFYCMEFRKPL